jgi:hypothetical protein
VIKTKDHNEAIEHNAGITARPRIMFPVLSTDELTRKVFGPVANLREFTAAFFDLGTPQHKELETEVSETDRKRLRSLTLLRCAYSANDPIARKNLSEVTRLLWPEYPGNSSEYFRVNDPKKIARWVYPALLKEELKSARLSISGKFVPEILCPNMTVAAFAFAAYRGIAVCLNCQKLFALDLERADGSNSEKYCTAACGQRYRQKIYRLKVKDRAKRVSKRKVGKR